MNRTQRILIAVGLAALAAMSAPYVLRFMVDRDATSGKALVYQADTGRAGKQLVLCLIKHPSSLNLIVASNDLYTDAASGLAVLVEDRGSSRRVKAYLPQGRALSVLQEAQLDACSGAPS